MWIVVLRRIVDAALVVGFVGTLSFTLLHLAPGDPISATLTDPRIAPEIRAHWRAVYGLDGSLQEQYWRYVGSLARGDLGYSFSQHRPVIDALRDAIPFSFLLMGSALVASVLLAVGLGTWQATRPHSLTDRVLAVWTGVLAAVPEVWVGLLLLAGLGAQLELFPLSGRCDPLTCGSRTGWRAAVDLGYHLVLPGLTLTLLFSAAYARLHRVALLKVMHDDVMRTARAKGLSGWHLLARHGLLRAAPPLVTVIGLSLPALIGGAVFVERVFGWPGMGTLLVAAVAERDYPLITSVAVVGSVLVLLGRLLSEIVGALLDPRRRTASG